MDSYKAHGIVLHTIKYGDTSVVAYILTDTYGRRNYLVQGVKSGKGKGNKAALLQHIPFDVRKSTISLFMAEVLYRLIKEVEPNSPLFGFVRASVMALDQMEEGISNFHLWFLVQLSAFLGFYPGNEYTEGDWFDIVEGSFTAGFPEHAVAINRPNAALLATLMSAEAEELGTLRLSRTQRADFLSDMLHYFGYHLDAINKVQSLRILGEIF